MGPPNHSLRARTALTGGLSSNVMRNQAMTPIRALLFLLLTASVAVAGEKTVSIPKSSAVIDIVISQKQNNKPKNVITDRKAIESVRRLVSEHNQGWSLSWHTYPTPQASVVFRVKDDSQHFVLWFGPNWVGARAEFEGKIQNVLWQVRPEVQAELRRLLAINV